MIQVNVKKFQAALSASSPDEMRDLLMSFGVKEGDAWNLAVYIRRNYRGIKLEKDIQMITLALPQDIELDFGG